jgi:parallel beta-helix repeat protein
MFEVTASDVEISGLEADQGSVQSSTCVYASGASRLYVHGMSFVNPKSGALLLNDNVSDVTFSGNRIRGAGYGVLANDNAGIRQVTIHGNTFDGTDGGVDAIEINGVLQDKFDITSTSNVVSNYASTSPETGFGIAYARVTRGVISGNVIRSCGRNGIHIEANSSGITVSANSVYDCSHAGIEVQGEFGKVCSAISILGNYVSDCCKAPAYNLGNGAIDLGASTGAAFSGSGATGIVVSGNVLERNRGAGVYAFAVTQSIISSNIIRNTYGASTDTVHAVQNTGIYAVSCTGTSVIFNQITDNQGASATSHFPIYYYGATALLDAGNNWAGTLAGITDATTGVPKIIDMTGVGSVRVDGGSNRLGLFGATPVTKPVVSGSKSSGGALASLISALAQLGAVTDSSTA